MKETFKLDLALSTVKNSADFMINTKDSYLANGGTEQQLIDMLCENIIDFLQTVKEANDK